MPSSSERHRAGVVASYLDGWRRVLRAPAVAVGVLAATLLTALPLALALGDAIEADLGSSASAGAAAEGWDPAWSAEFAHRAGGFAATLTHEVIGFGATLATTSAFLDAESIDPVIAAAVAVYLGVWMFLWGGILDRYARQRPIDTAPFFAACGVFFLRFLRLWLIIGPLYWAVFAWLHPLLFGTAYDWWTRDLTAERDAVVVRAGLYLVMLGALAAIGLAADFARVRAVVEDRRSMIGAFLASARFVRQRLVRVIGLYLLNVFVLAGVALAWFAVAPGATAPAWLAFLAAQIYLLLRLWTRLSLAAAEVSFFQAELAHADYAAAPLSVWPDSPTVEGLRNLERLKP